MATKQESGILLRGGTVLAHDEDMHVRPLRADVLIKGKTIVKISEDLSVPVGTEVIDCIGKLLCPGFVNGHQHIWQTALKGQHANDTLVPYMPTGNLTSALYTLEDAFWGELSGAMESIDCGTTTVVDHSSLNQGPDYRKSNTLSICYSPSLSKVSSENNSPGPGNVRPARHLRILPLSHRHLVESAQVRRRLDFTLGHGHI